MANKQNQTNPNTVGGPYSNTYYQTIKISDFRDSINYYLVPQIQILHDALKHEVGFLKDSNIRKFVERGRLNIHNNKF